MNDAPEQIIRGTVEAILFQNHENGYSVLKLRTEEGAQVTVVGTIPMTITGERLIVTGKWTRHASYGEQFEAEFLERLMPESTPEILAFLSSRAVKGVGARTAEKIVSRFGAQSLEILENEPERLAEIPGVTLKKAEQMSQSFRRQSGVRRLIEFLTVHHLPAQLAVRLYRVYGELAPDALRDDPYLLTDPYYGADFSLVDAFAIELEIPADDERRVEAGILFELSYNLSGGHVFIPKSKLRAVTASLLGLEEDVIEAGLSRLQEQSRMTLDTVAGLEACYLPTLYEDECYVCARVCAMAKTALPAPPGLAEILSGLQRTREIRYAAMQLSAIRAAAGRQLLLVTGGPGTGKTTVMSGILGLFDAMKRKTLLAAPTGRAAKRLSECTGRDASTIHRLLEAQFDEESGSMRFFHDEENPLACDALIVDEASMIDLPLMASLLRALRPSCTLILVGDPDQLPSVGPGNVFSDLIRSHVAQTVCLTEIFRQAQKSLIVMNAHAINRGEMPVLTETHRDFFFLRRKDPAAVQKTIESLCAERLPQKLGVAPSEIQVLSPTRKGETGTKELNRALQAVLNPPAPGRREKKSGDFSFREGDRVMQIRNNYDIMWKKTDASGSGSGIFNGDIGLIRTIDYETELVTIDFDDRRAEYGFDMLQELEPAYAMTVHKSQGSEYRAVILAVFSGAPVLLTRNVLYTAVTRARELLILVGDERVVAAMTRSDRRQRRYSALKLRLEAEAHPQDWRVLPVETQVKDES